jgi:DNA-binding NtrC family response regulator
LPTLRARRSDIPALAEALLARINQANQANCYLTGEAMDKLMNYDYPGNVRELRNIMQRAVALCSSSVTGAIHGREIIFSNGSRTVARQEPARLAASAEAGEPSSMRDVEARYIAELLERYVGQRRLVAQALGISERTLYRKLRLYGLK